MNAAPQSRQIRAPALEFVLRRGFLANLEIQASEF
jgi:hypothetical protein